MKTVQKSQIMSKDKSRPKPKPKPDFRFSLSPELQEQIENVTLGKYETLVININFQEENNDGSRNDNFTIGELIPIKHSLVKKLISKYAKPEKILHIQFKDLCMQMSNEKNKFFSQRREYIGHNNGKCGSSALVEVVKRMPIDQRAFPILRKYPIKKNIIRNTIRIPESSAVIIIDSENNNKNPYIKVEISNNKDITGSTIKCLCNAINEKISEN